MKSRAFGLRSRATCASAYLHFLSTKLIEPRAPDPDGSGREARRANLYFSEVQFTLICLKYLIIDELSHKCYTLLCHVVYKFCVLSCRRPILNPIIAPINDNIQPAQTIIINIDPQ